MEVIESVPTARTGSDAPTARPLGARALQTRQRILDATLAELEQKSMRDLRVIDIARRVGSSPATFYQYFKDIEDAVLDLSDNVSEQTPLVVNLIHSDWEAPDAMDRAKKIVEFGIQYWDKNGAVLRVRNNASDEGDVRFQAARARSIMPTVNAFAEEIAAAHERARKSGTDKADGNDNGVAGLVDPMAAAMGIFAAIDRLSAYHAGIAAYGPTRQQVIDTGAWMIWSVMTSRG